jgi:predicted transcriptional regulator
MVKIIIRSVQRPNYNSPEALIHWFCAEFNLSDENNISMEEQILKEFVNAAYNNHGLSSTELSSEHELARSTVIYHLNRLIETGLLVKRGRRYYLRANELSKAIEEMQLDIEREMRKMMLAAMEFDRAMNARARGRLHGHQPTMQDTV